MEVITTEEGIVFCDKLLCDLFMNSKRICDDCPLKIIKPLICKE